MVFNTSLTGYQEIMTDPSYAGQMVCFTAAHLGNTGTNAADDESAKAWLDGAIVRSLSPLVSSYRSEASLSAFCEAQGVVGISEVDTRALTRRLRDTGAMPGVICTDPGVSDAALVAQLGGWTLDGKDMASMVSTQQPYSWTQPTDAEWGFGPDLQPPRPGPRFRVVAYDFGVKRRVRHAPLRRLRGPHAPDSRPPPVRRIYSNILRRLASHGCDVVVVPCGTSAAEVLALSPDGVFLSNGPGDPQALPYAVASARALLGAVPLFGICMGHQLLGMALGGRTYKMKASAGQQQTTRRRCRRRSSRSAVLTRARGALARSSGTTGGTTRSGLRAGASRSARRTTTTALTRPPCRPACG